MLTGIDQKKRQRLKSLTLRESKVPSSADRVRRVLEWPEEEEETETEAQTQKPESKE